MALEDLYSGLNPYGSTYSMMQDPIYGMLFRGLGPGGPVGAGGAPNTGGRGPVRGVGPGTKYEQIAREMAQRRFGWGPNQFKALDTIVGAESGWNPKAVNPSSGAAGIPQMLPSAHPDINVKQFLNDPMQQIRWMLNYVSQRYGSPLEALAFREQKGWY
jgi:hypothetical protein